MITPAGMPWDANRSMKTLRARRTTGKGTDSPTAAINEPTVATITRDRYGLPLCAAGCGVPVSVEGEECHVIGCESWELPSV
jgi:hypothetical protein